VILEKILDCYFSIVVRMLNRGKIRQAKELLLSVSATIEKIDSNDNVLSQGLTLKYHLCTLKLFKAEIEHRPPRNDVDDRPAIQKLWAAGFEKATEVFPFLSGIRDQVRHFFVVLECLIYFCYFSVMVGNVSQTYHFGSVIKAHLDNFIKKIEDDDKTNLLIEVMIFCKKYQIPKNQRFELYYLLMIALIYFAVSIWGVDQRKRSMNCLEKVKILCKTIEPESPIFVTLDKLITDLKLQPQVNPPPKDVVAAQIQIRVTEEKDYELIREKQRRKEQQFEEKKKLKIAQKARDQVFSENLFLPGVESSVLVNTGHQFEKKHNNFWSDFNKKVKEKSAKDTIMKEYKEIEERENSFLKSFQPKDLSVIKSHPEVPKYRPLSSSKPVIPKKIEQFDTGHKVSSQNTTDKHRASLAKLFVDKKRPKTANVSLNNSEDRLVEANKALDKIIQGDNTGSQKIYYVREAISRTESNERVQKGDKVKPQSIARQLKALLYKADIKEMMPDQYIFSKFTESKNEGKVANWNHDKRTTAASDSSSGFNIDKNWFYDRMMAERLGNDPDRVLTNNKTMSIKNQQVMIEFKTGDHPDPPPPKKRAPSAYMHRSYLIKCSYDGSKNGMVKKGRMLGYTNYQFEERKKSYEQDMRAMKIPNNTSSAGNLPGVAEPQAMSKLSINVTSKKMNTQPDKNTEKDNPSISNGSIRERRKTQDNHHGKDRMSHRSASKLGRDEHSSNPGGRPSIKEESMLLRDSKKSKKNDARRSSLYPEKEDPDGPSPNNSHSNASRELSEDKKTPSHMKAAVEKVQKIIAIQKKLMAEGKLPKTNIEKNFFENLRSSSGFILKDVV